MSITKPSLQPKYDYFRMVMGMTRHMVEQFPEDKFDYKPVPEVRSVSELLSHMYAFLVEAAVTVQKGVHTNEEEPKLGGKAEVLAYMDRQVERFYQIWGDLTEENLNSTIEAYGTSFPAHGFLNFAYDEHWHHRGQLAVYLRMCGVEPLMIYDYGRLHG